MSWWSHPERPAPDLEGPAEVIGDLVACENGLGVRDVIVILPQTLPPVHIFPSRLTSEHTNQPRTSVASLVPSSTNGAPHDHAADGRNRCNQPYLHRMTVGEKGRSGPQLVAQPLVAKPMNCREH